MNPLANNLNNVTIDPSSNVEGTSETTDNDHISNPTTWNNILP